MLRMTEQRVRLSALSETGRRKLRYGALALAIVLLVAGVVFLSHRSERTGPVPAVSGQTPPASSGRRAAVDAATGASDTTQSAAADDVAPINVLLRDEAVELIAQARRQAAAGNFSAADAALARASKAAPNLPEIGQARLEIARLKTPEGQFALQLQRARLAIDHDDAAAAEAALDEAARLRPDAPQIGQLRAELRAAHDKKARREARIAEALARMREAVSRRDFGAADSALNEAERIDLQDPTIRRARGELARARAAPSNTSD
jgi:hypothetical protein